MKLKTNQIAILLLLFGLNCSCKKYLDAKSNQSLVIISNLSDLQSLLDNYSKVNSNNPSADEVSSDEYYLVYNDFQALDIDQQRNMYTWQPDNLFYPYTNLTNDWTQVYNCVYIANTVLDNIGKIPRTSSNASSWDNIKGQALFLRAYSFYKAATIWSLAYDPNTSNSDLGIPLRLTSDFNEKSIRASVCKTYAQILSDTKMAAGYLSNVPVHVYRSSKPAAFALIAKCYLSMRQYDLSGLYADSCLQINNALIDYNSLNSTSTYPLPQFNKEVIYDTYAGGIGATPVSYTFAKIDTVLYSSYNGNDLRKTCFFSKNSDGSSFFKGSYHGSSVIFNGIATDEVYLMRAECYARQGNVNSAMTDLNTLLKNRYKTGSYTTIAASSSTDAVSKILDERHKELVMRGTRWIDIKRLNKEGAGINLKRLLNGKIYTLPANDLRFALAIPDDIISLSGIPQNPR